MITVRPLRRVGPPTLRRLPGANEIDQQVAADRAARRITPPNLQQTLEKSRPGRTLLKELSTGRLDKTLARLLGNSKRTRQ